MCATLCPWQPSNGHAYMDDRSIVNLTAEMVADDLTATQTFDCDCGFFKENLSKRQLWSR